MDNKQNNKIKQICIGLFLAIILLFIIGGIYFLNNKAMDNSNDFSADVIANNQTNNTSSQNTSDGKKDNYDNNISSGLSPSGSIGPENSITMSTDNNKITDMPSNSPLNNSITGITNITHPTVMPDNGTSSVSVVPTETVVPVNNVTPIKTVTPAKYVTPFKSVTPIKAITPLKSVTPIKAIIPTKKVTPAKIITPTKVIVPSHNVTPTNTIIPTKHPVYNFTPTPTPFYCNHDSLYYCFEGFESVKYITYPAWDEEVKVRECVRCEGCKKWDDEFESFSDFFDHVMFDCKSRYTGPFYRTKTVHHEERVEEVKTTNYRLVYYQCCNCGLVLYLDVDYVVDESTMRRYQNNFGKLIVIIN